ncbi:hypothetical protein JIN77_06780 [Verrucomicrobiaceae bacterium R5-34]|uniref:Uncharacterized protein n=1 Tax=Oceaniferula flava TaxID=2800421 RepID=A0AAE2VC19_9BACT|nr:hypothetical protein [Oceaniferula flavus]MBK1830423.1 hypothetical protein [Verrucomicrobiaceae bacterium R5-34]MBK1854516.1 hypothetical protein [Oceaniferula flavus]MBM1135822.1 hypothetical protein [Oceaniferula flavus]
MLILSQPLKSSLALLFAAVAALVLASCASETTVSKERVRKDAWGDKESFSVGKDKDGNPVMKSDKRSSLEGKTSHIASNRDFSGQDFTKKSYRKKRWGGNTLFGGKKYEGNTDASKYKQEPWFVQKQAHAQGQTATVSNQSYSVNPFRTRSAHEQGGSRMAHTSDAETDVRRRVFVQPEITEWEKQSGLSVGDTNRMLGR